MLGTLLRYKDIIHLNVLLSFRLVSLPNHRPVVQVVCGGQHTLALTQGNKYYYSWFIVLLLLHFVLSLFLIRWMCLLLG